MKATMLGLLLVALLVLPAARCMGDTPIELCYTHPVYGAVCVKINGKSYDINRTDLTPAQLAEVKDWLAKQPK